MESPSEFQRNVNLLQEQPACKDEFSGQGHARVAQGVINTITSGNDDPAAIGLEGQLGGGKSTVVELIKKGLENNDKKSYSLFTFDCQRFQHGPLRRAFLEQLTNHVQGLCDKQSQQKLEEIKQKISGRLTEFSREVTTKLKPSAFVLFLCTFLGLPALRFLYSGLFGTNKFELLTLQNIALIGLALSPLLASGLIWIYYRVFHKKTWNPAELITRGKNGTITERQIKSPQITSLELADFFHEIVSFIPKNKELVLVLDNIDRLSHSNFDEVWSDMDMFVCHGSMKEGIKRNWVIVPYDVNQIKNALKEQQENGNYAQIQLSEFINKRFTTRYPVPPLLLGDWKEYFRKQWHIAFPDKCENRRVVEDIASLFAHLHDGGEARTPRNIKFYINEIAAIYQIWGDEYDLRIMALYVLMLRHKQESLLNTLKDDRLSEGYIATILLAVDSHWVEQLAALHFCVPRDRALSVLLEEPTREAIERNDVDHYRQQTKVPGFPEVLSHMLAEEVGATELATLCSLQLECREQQKDEINDRIAHIIEYALTQHQTQWGLVPESKKYLASADKLLGKKAVDIIQKQAACFKKYNDEWDIQLWIENADAFSEYLHIHNHPVQWKADDNTVVNKIAPHMSDYKNLTLQQFKGQYESPTFWLHLLAEEKNDVEKQMVDSAIAILSPFINNLDFQENAKICPEIERLTDATFNDIYNKSITLERVQWLAIFGSESQWDTIATYFDHGFIADLKGQDEMNAQVAYLTGFIKHEKLIDLLEDSSNRDVLHNVIYGLQEDKVELFKQLFRPFTSYTQLIKTCVQIKDLGGLIYTAATEKWWDNISYQIVLEKYDKLAAIFEEYDNGISQLLSWYQGWANFIKFDDYCLREALGIRYIKESIEHGGTLKDITEKAITDYFTSGSNSERWKDTLQNTTEQEMFGLNVFRKMKKRVNKSSIFHDVMRQTLQDIVAGSLVIENNEQAAFLSSIVELLPSFKRDSWGLTVRSTLLKNAQNTVDIEAVNAVITIWGSFFKPVPVKSEEAEGLVNIVCSSLENQDKATKTLEWLSDNRDALSTAEWKDWPEQFEALKNLLRENEYLTEQSSEKSILYLTIGNLREVLSIKLDNDRSKEA